MNRSLEIEKNLHDVRERISKAALQAGRDVAELTLIAVTKNFPISDIEILKKLGISNFGENRDSEGVYKAVAVEGIWHFQGQIQSNKLKSICSWSQVIHSLDDLRHFRMIEKFATHPLQIFLQINLDGAKNRGGAHIQELFALAQAIEANSLHNLAGLMAVAPLGSDPNLVFSGLRQMHLDFLKDFPRATSLSAGMSGDFEAAISHGATHLRIGSQILGSR
ncbi:MAG: PLP dependent protein [Actinobacteria bacterium]|jgi:pyridoxal phosphate enzyme (YggS family)|nr:PLP dependent protein [Actinomycetota bacterium]